MVDKPVAILDLDDTLIDLKQEFIRALNRELKKYHHWTQWYDVINNNTIEDNAKNIALKHNVAFNAKPHLFAIPFLYELKRLGYYIVIVTARGGFFESPYELTQEYLRHHRMVYDELIVTNYGEKKVDSLDKFDTIELVVDDAVYNCVDFLQSGKVKYIFLPALPWNKKHPKSIIRIYNLYQVFHHMGIKL